MKISLKDIQIQNSTYTFQATYTEGNYHVDIEVFRCMSETYWEKGVDLVTPIKNYPRKGATSSMDDTQSLADAQRVLSCYVKWDGCSDIDFYPDRKGNEHFCGKKSATEIGLVIDQVYEFARETMGSEIVHDIGLFND
jgi:hypothetical protein